MFIGYDEQKECSHMVRKVTYNHFQQMCQYLIRNKYS